MQNLSKWRTALGMVALSIAAGCGGDSSTTPQSVAGTWNLTALNGAALPFVVQSANPKVEILAERLDIASGGTFTQTTTTRIAPGTASMETDTDTGTWTSNGNAATFRFKRDDSTGTGTSNGNTFTASGAGAVFTYTKQ
jgi:hypothetical protein